MLPDLIEIVPLAAPVHAEITVPGSKSITNRALVLAALADGEVTLEGALWSEDTQVMVDCLKKLGFDVRVDPDPNEFCNRTITVRGRGGEIPNAGTAEKPLELFVGNAGTAARFLAAMVCLGRGVYRLSGVPRMHERPQAALFQALRELGYRVESENANDKLPVRIHHRGTENTESKSPSSVPSVTPWLRKCRVSIEASSQFASALLLCAERGGWQIEVVGENAEESPYVAMTTEMIKVFPRNGGKFQIEPDASSGSYFWATQYSKIPRPYVSRLSEKVLRCFTEEQRAEHEAFVKKMAEYDAGISVRNWPSSDWQIDAMFPFLTERFPSELSRLTQLGDSIMTAIAIAPLQNKPVRFTHLARLRVQECERVVALRTELTKCGAEVVEHNDTLIVQPSKLKLHGAEIETYDDHRMAMCFAVLGLKVPGIKLRNPSCVKKTFPNFFQKLAAAPPHGLGVTILDGHTGRRLSHDELFAE
jgi:3-phosphoshikimate 1-carboxyvinyltransferase